MLFPTLSLPYFSYLLYPGIIDLISYIISYPMSLPSLLVTYARRAGRWPRDEMRRERHDHKESNHFHFSWLVSLTSCRFTFHSFTLHLHSPTARSGSGWEW